MVLYGEIAFYNDRENKLKKPKMAELNDEEIEQMTSSEMLKNLAFELEKKVVVKKLFSIKNKS